jgi:hypothetical protein
MRTFEKWSTGISIRAVHGVVEHHAVVGLGDAGRLLHRLRREPDLAPHEGARGDLRSRQTPWIA